MFARQTESVRFSVTRRFAAAAAGNLLIAAAAALLLAQDDSVWPVAAALAFLAACATVATAAVWHGYPHARIGWCNIVTQLRAAMAGALLVPVFAPGSLAASDALAWIAMAIAGIALALDGLDGVLARRSRLESPFGARFDMEVDAFLGLVLAVLALQSGKAGLWVLSLGVLRYVFLAGMLVWPWLRADLPHSQRRKAICVVQIATLVALLSPWVTPPVSVGVAAVASVLLLWSFAVDALWLFRHRMAR